MQYRFDWKQYINGYADLVDMNEGDAMYHWEMYGRNENRKVKIPFNTIKYLDSTSLLQTTFDIIAEKSNIIINLSTTPERIITNNFYIVIEHINNQILKPKYIVINIYNHNKNQLNIFATHLVTLRQIYPNLIFNEINDKSIKVLALFHSVIDISDDDIIICIDDTNLYHHNMTVIYNLCFQLYNCDCIFIKNNIKSDNFDNVLFYDNYQDFVNLSLSYAIKYKYIKRLTSFYDKLIHLNSNIWNYEDIIVYLFYKVYKLYAIGINCILYVETIENAKINDLIIFDSEKSIILSTLLSYFCLPGNLYSVDNKNESIFRITKKIDSRYLLFNINEISYDPLNNNFHYLHIDIKYINQLTIVITLTHYDEKEDDYTDIILDHNVYFASTIRLPYNKFSKRYSYFIVLDFPITKIEHKKYDFSIMQTNKSNKISQKCFYSILSILCYLPDLNYEYYNNTDTIKYFNNKYPKLLNVYLKIIPGAFRADFFRMIYLYDNKGIYFDCKMILLSDIEYLLYQNHFVYDYHDGNIYNAFLINTTDKNNIFKEIIINMIANIKTENYTESKFGITGPLLLGQYIKDNITLRSKVIDYWEFSFIVFIKNNKIIIKNMYNGYYNENNNHKSCYHKLWEQKKVFDKNIIIDDNIEYFN